MPAKTLAALSLLATMALSSSAPASAAVLTMAPGGATFSGESAARAATARAPAAVQITADARRPSPAPEPETYALLLAGLLFVGLRTRAQRP